MGPIYKFFLSADDGTSQEAYPIYKASSSKDFTKESGEEFFRASFNGDIVFEGPDYRFIEEKPFETEFKIEIKISYDAVTFVSYWKGKFFKIGCHFDEDKRIVLVKPDIDDEYAAVLAGMEKEYNLAELAPSITPVKLKKRPCLQIYDPGKDTLGFAMFGNGIYWESPCEETNNPTPYHFKGISQWFPVKLTFESYPNQNVIYQFSHIVITGPGTYQYPDYTLTITAEEVPGGGVTYGFLLTRIADNAQWSATGVASYGLAYLDAVEGTGADWYHVEFEVQASLNLWGRIIADVPLAYSISANDIAENNRNYSQCGPWDLYMDPNPDLIVLSANYSPNPTSYGIYQPGLYFDTPDTTHKWVPIARNSWSYYSIWLNLDEFFLEQGIDTDYSKEYTLKDAYPLQSVISRILEKIAPDITHLGSSEYSQFLYGTNPISETDYKLILAPKSNILKGEYDQPAQKAPITLRQITDMLRDCFRCYWFIENGKFKIEHIKYFQNGGSYDEQPGLGVDLTVMSVSRSGKKWSFAKNAYQFDKADIPSRMEFGWMDDVTEPFEGSPIDIRSKYAEEGKTEAITIDTFTSDVDYMLLSPNECSLDGFGLFGVIQTGNDFVLPLVLKDGAYYQNGYLAFWYLQRYYFYDMPAPLFSIGSDVYTALGTKQLRIQEISFPCAEDPDLKKLIKTGLGLGKYEKVSVNLSSRLGKVTLRYATE